MEVSRVAAKSGLEGLEFFIGIPGTIGGALKMNAGSYGSETKNILIEAQAVDREGKVHNISSSELQMEYRKTKTPADWIFISSKFKAQSCAPDIVRKRMKHIILDRSTNQPQGVFTGGSTFKNPTGLKSWKLIDQAGCRGMSYGGAKVSEIHCNFLVNTGTSKASDIEYLGEIIRGFFCAGNNESKKDRGTPGSSFQDFRLKILSF